MYETFGLTPDGDERVDAMNLHRWADAFVDGIRLYVCHDDHEAYDRILEVAREQSAELTADEIIGSAVLSFMMLTVYCVGAMAKTNEHHVCVQAVENLADIATRYIQDLRSIVPKTP